MNIMDDNDKKLFKTRGTDLLAKSIASFTCDLYKCISNEVNGNFVNSALGAHMVLAMCMVGSRNETEKEMHTALCLHNNYSLTHFKYLIENLQKEKWLVRFGMVNKIFTDSSIIINNNFKKQIATYFNSEIEEMDFRSNKKSVVKAINDWCAMRTEDKIKHIISEDDITPTTKLFLTNAVYFKACWRDKFGTYSTYKEPFHIDDKTTIDVATMHNSSRLYYRDLKTVDAECIGIPYEDLNYVFIIIMPRKINGLEIIEKNLRELDLDFPDFCTYDNSRNTHLSLPKFKIESTINLNDHLQELGMVNAFSDNADFKGISSKPVLIPPIYIDKVLQKAFIEVNEEGTEATAFTFIRQSGGGRAPTPEEYHDFKVDRPFLFQIVNNSSNVVLFSGRVLKPVY